MKFFKNLKWKKELLFSALMTVPIFFQELWSFLFLKKRIPQDREMLERAIRKRAHHVERFILTKSLYDPDFNDCEQWVRELEDLLKMWGERGESDLPDILWARRILAEYSESAEKGEGCTLRNQPWSKETKTIEEAIFQRRSIRLFKDKAVEKEKVLKLVSAAQQAPSSCNRQSLSYLAIEEREVKEEVAETISGGKPFAKRAPLLLMVLVDKRDYRLPEERFTPYQDAAASIQNILLMAEHLGLGACWCSYTSYSSVKNEAKVRQLLHIPEKLLICGIIIIGYPSQDVCPVPRRDAKEVLFWNTL